MTPESTNAALFARARGLFPGGVSSPVRAYGSVGGDPRFIVRAEGCRVWDADGVEYVDWVSSWGAILLGHAHPEVVAAIKRAANAGTSYGAPTPGEIALGERIAEAMPAVERMRFTSSGTEATMSALRLARAHTGRDRFVKLAGCYHGHADPFLVEAGSGVATLGIPGSAGVPAAATKDTLVAPYNDLDAVRSLFDDIGGEIAAVFVEPVAANMGVVPPADGYLEGLREVTAEHGALLVFDEVITGFRMARGGAQERFGVTPDLTTLGKVIGGGLPVGAFGGRGEILATVAPEGPMYQAGTLSGNPLAMAAGEAALAALADPAVYEAIEGVTTRLAEGLAEAGGDAVSVTRSGPLLTVFFAADAPTDYAAARAADHEAYARFFHAMLERGVMLPPSGYEAWFPNLAHDDEAVERTLDAARESFEVAFEGGSR